MKVEQEDNETMLKVTELKQVLFLIQLSSSTYFWEGEQKCVNEIHYVQMVKTSSALELGPSVI